MTQQVINTGTAANDATGDPLQTAFSKCNANFTELYTAAASVNVIALGADPTGTRDSTAAFTKAGATGLLIYLPTGTYKVSSGITIIGGGMVGDGAYKSKILTTDTASANVFTYTGTLAGRFENFQISPASTKSGGYAIVIQPTSGEVSAMRFFEMVLNAMPNGINFVAASLWSIVACNFYGYTGDAITVNNTNNPDSGDSAISVCVFTSPGNASANSIHQIASGGLKLVGNKFNNGGIHYFLDLGTGSTSDLLVVGNSFENASTAAMKFQRSTGAATFSNVTITGNQFLLSSSGGASIGVYSNNGSSFLARMSISGNDFFVADSTGAAAAINLDWISDLLIGDNTIRGPATGTTSQAIVVGSNCSRVKIGVNQASGFAQRTCNWPGGTNYIASDFQTGTANVTTSSALGSLFSGQTTITFSSAYSTNAVPTLQNCSATVTSTTGGGICAQVISVSATQLVINVIGTSNGGSVPIQWSVGGVT